MSKKHKNGGGQHGGRAQEKSAIASVDPLIFAAGAVIAGAAVGALVPRTAAEERLLAPIGPHVKTAVATFGAAARQAISEELGKVPVVGQVAADQLDHFIDGAGGGQA